MGGSGQAGWLEDQTSSKSLREYTHKNRRHGAGRIAPDAVNGRNVSQVLNLKMFYPNKGRVFR